MVIGKEWKVGFAGTYMLVLVVMGMGWRRTDCESECEKEREKGEIMGIEVPV
jgi:hypothetical protein